MIQALSDQYPALLVAVPLLMAFATGLSGFFWRRVAFYLTTAALVATSAVAVALLLQVATHGPMVYRLGGWDPPMGIAYYIDTLNGLVMAVMSIAALLNCIGTKATVDKDHEGKVPAFYTLYLLAVTGHLGIVATGDLFNLYVLLEIAALSGYALLGMGSFRAPLSTLNYLFIGTIGASLYLLGVGFIYIKTGSLNMLDVADIIAATGTSPTLLGGLGLILVGLMVKMAFFPLHAWLPNAYSHASSAASGLIAPMTTKVMVYAMARVVLTVFTPGMAFSIPGLAPLIVWMAVAAIIAGAAMALASRDLKRMLTFIIVSEVGYMVGGIWLGNATGMTGAILHIANDAAMTLCVFLAVACMVFRLGRVEFTDLQGLFGKMPFTMLGFAAGAIAMIGVPPTCGFFSKWYLLLGGIEAGHYGFVAALIISSLVNVVLFFRIFEIAFFEPKADHGHGGEDDGHHHGPAPVVMAEAPVHMVVALLATAAALVLMGLYTQELVGIIGQVMPNIF